jgi:2',3'-cyclic-nucleotide 2'-phosphodiesterase (5'-nucleotidase family)
MRRQLTWLTLAVMLALASCKGTATVSDPAPPTTLPDFSMLHLNDVYEISPLAGGQVGGMARIATLRQELLAETPQTYTLLAGDFLSPSVIGTVKLDGQRVKGAQMVEVMNAVGVDWVAFGNHEFDLSETELQARLDESEFTWLGGNVQHLSESGAQPFEQRGQALTSSQVIEVPVAGASPIRMGLLSLCLPANRQPWVAYQDLAASALAQWDDLSQRSDFVVAITHQTIEQDRALARLLPELKLIMGGHEHEDHYERVGPVPIAKADANAKSAYIHRVSFDPKRRVATIQSTLREIDASIPPDPAVAQLVESWETRALAAFQAQGFDLNATVATVNTPLDGLEAHIRTQQTNLGGALTRAMYQAYPRLDAALTNSGSVRLDDRLSGQITQYDLVRALPFGGQVLKVSLKGSLLAEILDAGERNRGSGGYLQRYLIRKAESTEKWLIDGQQLDPEKTYQVAISDYLLTGLEKNLDFLTPDHPGIVAVVTPGPEDMARDVRLVLAEYLKNQ